MKKILFVLLALVLVASMGVTGCAPAEKETIKISDLNWGSAHFQAELARIIVMHGYGYPVEIVPGATIPMLQALQAGEVDITLEIWLPNQQEAWDKAIASGNVLDLGIMNNDNWQSLFIVPTYMIEGDAERGIEPMTPNLNSVSQLDQPEYKEIFKNPENPSKGAIVQCVPGWECEKINIDKVAAYGLNDDYDLINPGSQAGLEASMMGAYEKGEPWLGYYWGPTWISGLLDMTLLEEPPYDEAVWEENRGCAYPSADLHVAIYKDLPDRAPDVVEMLDKWWLDTAVLSEALSYMHEQDAEPFDAALWFIKEREQIWTQFVPDDVAQNVREAVASGVVTPPTTAE